LRTLEGPRDRVDVVDHRTRRDRAKPLRLSRGRSGRCSSPARASRRRRRR
jgi:hypothetical protein